MLGDWRLAGRWEGTTYYDAQAVESSNIYYTFYESGEYSLRNFNSEEYGYYRMDFDSNTISLKGDYSSLMGSFHGNELSVYDPNVNITYVYKK